MTDIELVNEGGKIVAKDIETGETVPIELGETETDALSADASQSNRYSYEYTSNYPPNPVGVADAKRHSRTFRETRGVSNPIHSRSDSSFDPSNGVADPFIVFDGVSGQYVLFYEVFDGSGEEPIAYATSADGINFTEQGLALDVSGDHHAYPYVFKWGGDWLMVPDPGGGGNMEIWRATDFPGDWELAETNGTVVGPDITPFYFDGRWYAYSEYNGTKLYYADEGDSLIGRTWTEHPESPIWTDTDDDVRGGAGRPIVFDSFVDCPLQQPNANGVELWRITELSTTTLSRQELSTSPIYQVSNSPDHWGQDSVHHLDMGLLYSNGGDHVIVDGKNTGEYSIAAFEPGEPSTEAVGLFTSTESSGGGWTVPDMSGRRYNEGGYLDTSTGKYTVPTTGLYQFSVSAVFGSGDTASEFSVQIENETQGRVFEGTPVRQNGSSGSETTVTATIIADVNSGDAISPQVYHTSGSDISLDGQFASRRVR